MGDKAAGQDVVGLKVRIVDDAVVIGGEKNGLYIGYLVSCFGRWVFAVLSGVVFFSSYAQEAGWASPLLYSCAYNGFYIAIEAGITLVILAIPAVRKAIDQIRRSAR